LHSQNLLISHENRVIM